MGVCGRGDDVVHYTTTIGHAAAITQFVFDRSACSKGVLGPHTFMFVSAFSRLGYRPRRFSATPEIASPPFASEISPIPQNTTCQVQERQQECCAKLTRTPTWLARLNSIILPLAAL